MDIFSVSEETPTPTLLGCGSSIKDDYLTGSWAHIVYNTDKTNNKEQRLMICSLGKSDCRAGILNMR